MKRILSVDVFVRPRCSGRLQRISWLTSADAIRAILTSIGLATDAPPVRPPRSAEDLFGQAA